MRTFIDFMMIERRLICADDIAFDPTEKWRRVGLITKEVKSGFGQCFPIFVSTISWAMGKLEIGVEIM